MSLDSAPPPLDLDHPENAGVLAHMVDRDPAGPPLALASSHPDPVHQAGSHPDVVQHVWTTLGAELPHARVLVYGGPALVHPAAGVVLAVALGTSYALRLPHGRLAEADALGLESKHLYTSAGVELDLATFGPTWRFGAFHALETEWIAEAATGFGRVESREEDG